MPPDNQRRVVSCPLHSLFILFWVFRYVHTPLRSLYPLSTFNAAHVRKKIHEVDMRVDVRGVVPDEESYM